jgi:oligoendopeptidase F
MTLTAQPLPNDYVNATWPDVLPRFDALATMPLSLDNVERWLADWSALESAVSEAIQLASVAYTVDTTDPAKEAAYQRMAGEIEPHMEEQRVRLSRRLLELGYTRPDLETTIRVFRNQDEIFREENVPLQQELQVLDAEYQKITGAMNAEWEGETLPLARLRPFLFDTDRAVRERAFSLQIAPYVEARDALAKIFDEQYRLRQQVAKNAGFDNFRDYSFRLKNRFDYSPADCETFHDAVEASVVPAIARRNKLRKAELGVSQLRPWDVFVDPAGRPGLKPFEHVDELAAGTEAALGHVSPMFGKYIATMRREKLLDLDSREGKAPGGYCTGFDYRKRPFIFMNAGGTHQDVETMLHEGGHAVHAFETYATLPLIFNRFPGEEISEVGSMAMELLASPYIEKKDGGFYSTEDANRARIEHLEGLLSGVAWIAAIDAFQHWIYTHKDGGDAGARDAEWLKVAARFNGGVDWSGLDAESLARWYRQLHIFLVPFYYIEYGIAQLGALQVWRNSLQDQAAAVDAYRTALALGATKPIPELFEAAGARFAFDRAIVAELVELVESELAKLEA